MANETAASQVTELIPELWRPMLLAARYAALKIGKRVLSVDGDVSKYGDILHIPIEPTLTVNSVTAATGAVTNQTWDPTEAQLTVDKWQEITVDVVDIAAKQTIGDLYANVKKSMPGAMAQDIDDTLAALHSDVTTNTVGATAAPLDTVNEDLLTSAVQKLLDLNIPTEDPNDISLIFHTSVWAQLKKIAAFNNANITGQATGGMLVQKVPDVYGIPVWFTSRIVSSGSGADAVRKNLLFHRQAFAWGMQKNFNIEMLARTRKSQPISADWLYGVKTVRQNHACVINTAA